MITSGPTDAERAWFEASDVFYQTLEKQGRAAALAAARSVLAILSPVDTPQRGPDAGIRNALEMRAPGGSPGSAPAERE